MTKNGETDGNYKSSVRMIKNARRYLVDQGKLAKEVAPSYFVECWLYNIPSDRFVKEADQTFYNILQWLHQDPQWNEFVCQNWQTYLFGPLPVQWALQSAGQLQTALAELWNNWGS